MKIDNHMIVLHQQGNIIPDKGSTNPAYLSKTIY